MSYWENGWSKTTTDAWKIKTTYDYNELGEQTNRTVTSAGNSSQRALDWSYYPDGKLKTHSDNGVPLGLDVVLDDNSDTGQVSATGSWTTTSGGSFASNVVGPRVQASATSGFVGYDYAVAPAGTGSSSFTWNLTIPADGSYKLYAQYPAGATATNAGYQVKQRGCVPALLKAVRCSFGQPYASSGVVGRVAYRWRMASLAAGPAVKM
ncbi:hypothetical protein ACIBHX_13045 [Nonomuraea sp. NPDC050536]|uniref:golvesin C-terminal-like domain-containing protein n=1 Tax=Nonomuraea sp. NPDC050536 TaxID=3364366 RepID=UPI0037C6B59C